MKKGINGRKSEVIRTMLSGRAEHGSELLRPLLAGTRSGQYQREAS